MFRKNLLCYGQWAHALHSRAKQYFSKTHNRFQSLYAESLQSKAKYNITFSSKKRYQDSNFTLFFFIQISYGLQNISHRLKSLVQILVVTELSQLVQKHSKVITSDKSAGLIGPSAHMSTESKCLFRKYLKNLLFPKQCISTSELYRYWEHLILSHVFHNTQEIIHQLWIII